MAGPYSQGGGGGAAGSGSQIDSNALDKPYDLAWPWTADSVQKLDEMLRLLFLSSTKNADAISTAGGSGDVVGPASAVSGDVPIFNGTTGKVLADGGKLASDLVTGPAVSNDGFLALFNGTTGKVLKQVSPGGLVGSVGLQYATLDLTAADIVAAGTTQINIVTNTGAQGLIPVNFAMEQAMGASTFSAGFSFTLRHSGTTANLANALAMSNAANRTGYAVTNIIALGIVAATTLSGRHLCVNASGAVTGGSGSFRLSVGYYAYTALV